VPEWPLARILDGVAAAGFRGIGLDAFTVGDHVRSGGRLEHLSELLDARGLACTDVGVLPVGSPDVLAAAEDLARLALATEAHICLASHFASTSQEQAKQELSRAAEVLAAAGVRIALEFVAYGVLRTLAEAIELCEAVGWERCGLLVDTWHVFRGNQPLSLLRSLDGEQIAIVHVNDGAASTADDAVDEGRFGRLPVGGGAFPLAEFAAALEAIGYRGVISAEVLSSELRTRPPKEGARVLMRSLRESWPGTRS
jgi:sugar phosphate isomerase/epimerase